MALDTRITITAAGFILGKTAKTVYDWMNRFDDFPARGEDLKFSDLEIQAWAAKHNIPTRKVR